jgi:hypothetical protein
VSGELVKLFATNRVETLNSVGLLLALAGILLLFKYGMPYQVRTGAASLWTEAPNTWPGCGLATCTGEMT